MLPTPTTSHVPYERVYEPAEDSYLLLDTLSSPAETAWLHARFPAARAPLVLEVGTGSGVVLAFVAANASTIFGRPVATLGCDINAFACAAARETMVRTGSADAQAGLLGVVHADLVSFLASGSVDVLVFNPPYVPADLPDTARLQDCPTTTHMSSSAAFERDSHLLSLSYAGGVDGMEVTDRLLDELRRVLGDAGVAYVLLCAQNQPERVKQRVREWGGWDAETVGDSGKTAGWEKLCVVRLSRQSNVS